jgi:outer membrane biosynthesis protein TonB
MSGEDKELEDLNAADFADMGSLADFVDIEDLENLEGIEEFKSDEQSEDAPMPAEEVSEEIPMSVEKEVSEEIPMPVEPVEEEVPEEIPMPVEEKVSEEIPMPVEEEVSEEIPMPVEEEVSEEVPMPVEEKVSEEIPMPVEEEVSEEIPMSVAEASEEIPAPIDDGGTEEISQPAGDSATINTSELLDNINLYSDDVSGGDSAETAALMNDGKSESSTDDQALNMMLDGLLDDLDMTGSLQQETASKDELVEDQDAEAADIFDMLGADSESQDVSIDDLLDIAAPEEYPEEEPTDQKGLFQRVFGNVINDEIAEEERKAQEEEEQKAAEKAELAEQKKAEKEQAKEAKKAEKEAKKAAKAEEKAAKKAEKEAKKAEQKAQQEEEAEAEKYEVTGKLNKVGVAIIAILTVTFLVVEIAGTNIHGYSSSKKQAMKYFEMGKYEQAYQEVLGTKVKEKDPDTYNKIRTVMQVQRALDSYQNYDAMNYYPDALNALIRGLQRYDANLETAKQLEIEDEVDGCKEQIVSLLQSEYGVSESQARELLSLDKAEYTSKVVEIAMKKHTGNE